MATDLKASFKKLGQRVRGRESQVFLGVVVLLLVIRGLMFVQEQAAPGFFMPQPTRWAPPPIDEAQAADIDAVRDILIPWEPFPRSDFAVLTEVNVFDYKRVQDAERLEQQADQRYQEALGIARSASASLVDLERAGELLTEARALAPGSQRIRTLYDEVFTRIAGIQSPDTTDGESTSTPEGIPETGAGTMQ